MTTLLQHFRGELYGRQAATFVVAVTVEEAARALSRATRRRAGWGLASSIVGRVTISEVMLWRHRPFVSHGFGPVFRGKFQVADGQTVLQGHFALPLSVQVYFTLWFGAVAVATLAMPVVAVVGAARSGGSVPGGVVVGLLFSAASMVFGLGTFWLFMWATRQSGADKTAIATHVEEACGRLTSA